MRYMRHVSGRDLGNGGDQCGEYDERAHIGD